MANFEVEFLSTAVRGIQRFHVILPNDTDAELKVDNPNYDRPMKSMILLHGYNGTHTDWLYGTNINTLALLYNIAFVTPAGSNSFYLNDEADNYRFETYIGKELVDYTRKTFGLFSEREISFIGGFSMGGFGAIHTGLRFSETFGGIFGFSNAFIVDKIKKLKPGDTDFLADYGIYRRIFGDLNAVEDSHMNLKYLVKDCINRGIDFPKLYLACGTEDFLINENRDFRDFLKDNKVEAEYCETVGIHDWYFWQSKLTPALFYLMDLKETKFKDYFTKGD